MSGRPECPHCGKYAGLTGCFGDCIKQVEHTDETRVLCSRIEAQSKLIKRDHVIEQLGLLDHELTTLVNDKPVEFSELIENMISERWDYFSMRKTVRKLL
jgi:hypothetical protein